MMYNLHQLIDRSWTFQNIYTYGTVNFIFVEIQPDSTNIKNDPRTVKQVLSGHSKIDKTKGLMTNGSLMKIESIAECSLGAFFNTFDLH